jgi:hypothetical protein
VKPKIGKRSLTERLWSKVRKTKSCWLWEGSLIGNGYGQIGVGDGSTRKVLVHRLAWELTYGPIPTGLEVCHACDVPNCVRPAHLLLGTHIANMLDAARKGRRPSGEACHLSRLTAEDVVAIRERYGAGTVTQGKLAREYGVSPGNISQIITGRTWRRGLGEAA